MLLLNCHDDGIYKKVRCLRLTGNVGATEEERDRFAFISNKIDRNVKTLLDPVVRHTGVTALLHDTNRDAGWRLQLADKIVKALLNGLVCVRVPPIAHGNLGKAGGNRKVLPDTIITTSIAAEVNTILPCIGV